VIVTVSYWYGQLALRDAPFRAIGANSSGGGAAGTDGRRRIPPVLPHMPGNAMPTEAEAVDIRELKGDTT
jgi:hypothetical protein